MRSALEATRPTRFLQIVAGLNAGLPCSLLTPRGAGLSPCTEHHSAGPHQAASSRATLAGGTARAAKLGIFTTAPPAQICDQACSRPTLSVEMMPHVRGAAARRFSTSGFSTERVGRPHAWSQPVQLQLRRRCRRGEEDAPSKIAAEFLFRGLRARIDAIELNHVLRSHTAGHGPQLLSRGALAHSVRAVWCDCQTALCGAGEPNLICAAG